MLSDIPKLAARHDYEQRVLDYLDVRKDVLIPTSDVYHLQYDSQNFQTSKNLPSLEINPTAISEGNAKTNDIELIPPPAPYPIRDDNDVSTIKPASSPSESTVILTINIDPIESPLEWSARMRRYQEEEIRYLGLSTIKPQPSLPLKKTPTKQSVSPNTTSIKYNKLSKQRFEEWLDTLNPIASPTIPVSKPSTIAESEDLSSSESEPHPEIQPHDDSLTCRNIQPPRPMDPNCCSNCGRKIWSEVKSRDWGVQTDITARLVVFWWSSYNRISSYLVDFHRKLLLTRKLFRRRHTISESEADIPPRNGDSLTTTTEKSFSLCILGIPITSSLKCQHPPISI
jgi:hypothetical protein